MYYYYLIFYKLKKKKKNKNLRAIQGKLQATSLFE